MADALALLALNNAQALRVLVQENLKPGVSVGDLTISRPSVETGNLMSARVGVIGEAYERNDFPYFGAVNFNYHRLDLTDTFGELNISFRVEFPILTSTIMSLMSEIFVIDFTEDDYIQELIEASNETSRPYVIRAAPNSPRWMGQLNIQLHNSAG